MHDGRQGEKGAGEVALCWREDSFDETARQGEWVVSKGMGGEIAGRKEERL